MLTPLSPYRKAIVTGMLIAFSLGFLGFFEESSRVDPLIQGFIASTVFFLVIPFLYCKIILKEPVGSLGWQKGDVSHGIIALLFSLPLAVAALALIAYSFPEFRETYTLPVSVSTQFGLFLLYELLLVPITVLMYEVFFRGLIELLWLRAWGAWQAIVVQSLLFVGLLALSADLTWQKTPYLVFLPFAGYIAYRSRSIWYSFFASWLFIVLADIFLLSIH